MEGLILSHDRIAITTDNTPASIILTSSPHESYINKSLNQNANTVNNNVLKVRIYFFFIIAQRTAKPAQFAQAELLAFFL